MNLQQNSQFKFNIIMTNPVLCDYSEHNPCERNDNIYWPGANQVAGRTDERKKRVVFKN